MLKHPFLLLGIILLSILSCEKTEPTSRISVEAEAFLDDFIEIMQKNSINRDQINWLNFRDEVFAAVGSAQDISDTYDGVKVAIGLLGDNHTFLITPNGLVIRNSNLNCSAPVPDLPDIPAGIAIVPIPSFSGTGNQAISFAQDLQLQIRAQDRVSLKRWIIDLRGNTGGNMWPMLAGIGPILGEGIVGHFIAPSGNSSAWKYQNGASLDSGYVRVQLPSAYKLFSPNPKVAVLLDEAVASSGEAIAISFAGRANTRSFGAPTCGLSTANSGFNLLDGSLLFLTVSTMADRNKNVFGESVIPDEVVDKTEVVERAIEWLQQ